MGAASTGGEGERVDGRKVSPGRPDSRLRGEEIKPKGGRRCGWMVEMGGRREERGRVEGM